MPKFLKPLIEWYSTKLGFILCDLVSPSPLTALEEGHPEVGSESVDVELAGDARRGEEKTGPAVSVQRTWWSPLEKVS